jgi:hypothetical protein
MTDLVHAIATSPRPPVRSLAIAAEEAPDGR